MTSTSNYLPVRSEWLASGTEAALEPAMPIIDAHHHFYERPGWTYLRDGCPGGETAADLGRRADAVLSDLLGRKETVLIFGHSVILRVLTARWLILPAAAGAHFMLSPASLCMLAYDNVEAAPAIGFWNDRSHISGQRSLA